MKVFVLFFLSVMVISCAPDPTLQMGTIEESKVSQQDTERFEILRAEIFEDDLAYNHRRGIYLISDSVTGKQFIGISGIGIAELGNHYSAGRTMQRDER